MAITHRAPRLRAVFDERGLAVVPLLSAGVRLDWEEIDFVCVTPAMERDETGRWREKRYEFLERRFETTFARYGQLELAFVVKDRRPVLARTSGWWNRSWVGTSLRPMRDARDQLRLDQSLLSVTVKARRLDDTVDALLDLLAKKCRFDLVVFDF